MITELGKNISFDIFLTIPEYDLCVDGITKKDNYSKWYYITKKNIPYTWTIRGNIDSMLELQLKDNINRQISNDLWIRFYVE
jgi:hypothetical protein